MVGGGSSAGFDEQPEIPIEIASTTAHDRSS
jgi:hypothetical protein